MTVLLGRYRLPDEVMFTAVEDEYVMLHVSRGEYFSLNPVARYMFDRLREGCDEATVVERCVREYDVDAETVRGDLRQLVDELVAADILRVDDPAAGGAAS
jgi:hypothetical protein